MSNLLSLLKSEQAMIVGPRMISGHALEFT